MAYINHKFSVGDQVYWFICEEAAVYRGTVKSIEATSDDATLYGGQWDFQYAVVISGERVPYILPESALYSDPRQAFDALDDAIKAAASAAPAPDPQPEPGPTTA